MGVAYGWKMIEVPVPRYGEYRPGDVPYHPRLLNSTDYAETMQDVLYRTGDAINVAQGYTSQTLTDGLNGTHAFVAFDPAAISVDPVIVGRTGIQIGSTTLSVPAGSQGWPINLIGGGKWAPQSVTSASNVFWRIYSAPGKTPALWKSGDTAFSLLGVRVSGDARGITTNYTCNDVQWGQVQGANRWAVYFAHFVSPYYNLVSNPIPGVILAGYQFESASTGLIVELVEVGSTNPPTPAVAFLPSRGRPITRLVRQRQSVLAFAETGIWNVAFYSPDDGTSYRYQVEEISKIGPDLPGSVVDTGNMILFMRQGCLWMVQGRQVMPLNDVSRSILHLVDLSRWDDFAKATYAAWDASTMSYHLMLQDGGTTPGAVAWIVYDLRGQSITPRIISRSLPTSGVIAIGEAPMSGRQVLATVHKSGTNLELRKYLDAPQGIATWKTPWISPSPGKRVIVRRIAPIGNGNGSQLDVTLEISNSLDQVMRTVRWTDNSWIGETMFDPVVPESEFCRITLKFQGNAVIQGIRVYYEEVSV